MKQIKTHPNYYITCCGKVFSIKNNIYLKPRIHTKGYLRVCLRNDNKSKDFYIHRLVAKYYIKNPNNYKEINHIDNDKTNNRFKNLEWCSRSENLKHLVKSKNHRCPMRKGNPDSCKKFTKEEVLKIRELYKTNKYSQKDLSIKFDCSESAIHNIVTYKRWNKL